MSVWTPAATEWDGALVPRIRFLQPSGEAVEVDVAVGTSLMQAAVGGGVDGIVGECGGSRMCATCHVHVDLEGIVGVSELGEEENDLLDFSASPRSDLSRLGCQVLVGDDMDGIIVVLPERQT